MTSCDKSQLIREVERRISSSDYDYSISRVDVAIVDFMSFVRNQKVDRLNFRTFRSCIEELFNRICNTKHFIFVSYIPESWKGAKRKERTKDLIHLAQIASETPLPVQIEKFWGSDGNKKMLQRFCVEKLQFLAIQKQINVVLSGIIDNDNVTPAKYVDFEQGTTKSVSDLALNIEEADMRIMPHIKWNLLHFPNMSNIVVVSRDTDVTVYLLLYFKEFAELGLKKLWIAAGIGDKRRYIPIHHLFTKFGETFCKILLKGHLGSGCDYITKIGTKHSALNADPVTHQEFWRISHA